jgi:hypothetical protein
MNDIGGKKWSGVADFTNTGAAKGDDPVPVNDRADNAGEIIFLGKWSKVAGEIPVLRGDGHEREKKNRRERREAHGKEVYRLAAARTRIRKLRTG